jgi:hypothetical protein
VNGIRLAMQDIFPYDPSLIFIHKEVTRYKRVPSFVRFVSEDYVCIKVVLTQKHLYP